MLRYYERSSLVILIFLGETLTNIHSNVLYGEDIVDIPLKMDDGRKFHVCPLDDAVIVVL